MKKYLQYHGQKIILYVWYLYIIYKERPINQQEGFLWPHRKIGKEFKQFTEKENEWLKQYKKMVNLNVIFKNFSEVSFFSIRLAKLQVW